MKNFTKALALTGILLFTMTTVAFANPKKGPVSKPTVEVYFLNGNQVEAGDFLKTELTANANTTVDVVVEDPYGEVLGEKHLDIEKGSRLLKFKIEYVPAGTYTIKVCQGREVKEYPFVVK
jgi:23S rRNA U2552 (ribose-2'-O)-methylase RlmE/FtsJ